MKALQSVSPVKFISDRCTTYRRFFTPSTLETLLQSECRVSHALNLLLLLQQQLPLLPGCFIGLLKPLDLSLETSIENFMVKITVSYKTQLSHDVT